jgi:hypothetical protein
MNAHHREKDRVSGGYLNSCYVGCPFGHASKFQVTAKAAISSMCQTKAPSGGYRTGLSPEEMGNAREEV